MPGHERFIKNMLAGATGIDLAVLVVAADDSVMPQTREHLEILRLLGLRHGVIALTKCDLVDETTREVVELEIRELVQRHLPGRTRRSSARRRTPATGIAELKAAIAEACRKVEERDAARSGSAWPSTARSSCRGTAPSSPARSRPAACGSATRWNGCRAASGSACGRCKITTSRSRKSIAACGRRSTWPASATRTSSAARSWRRPATCVPSRALTVRLHCLADDARRPIKHRAPVRFHVGTAEIMGTVSLLDCDAIEPGEWGLAQLFLEEPATATWGQPFVVRESSATQTLGGGQVLQPVARKIRRRHLEMLERIERLWTGDDANSGPWRSPGSAASPASRRPTWCAGPASARTRPRR